MDLDATLRLLADDPAAPCDVAEVALRLARDEYPDLDVEAYLGELDAMAHEAQAYVRGDLEARLTGLCRYLFHEMGFRGNQNQYYDPRNSYLNEVLDRRTGIPISLTAVAMAVGRRAGLTVVGVGLPGHFVAKAVGDEEELLFDPFHGGRRLTEEQCEVLVQRATKQPFSVTPAALRAVPAGSMLTRMLNNLKGIYLQAKDHERAERVLGRILQLVPGDLSARRDLGLILLRDGRAGPAIDHLEAYLREAAGRDDEEAVQRMLAAARREVARWN